MKAMVKNFSSVAFAAIAYFLPHWWLFGIATIFSVPMAVWTWSRLGGVTRQMGWGNRQLWWTYAVSAINLVAELVVFACFGKIVVISWILFGYKALNSVLNVARMHFGQIPTVDVAKVREILAN